MFRSIKATVSLSAIILLAAPGCCLTNLLCSHTPPKTKTVVSGCGDRCVSESCADCGYHSAVVQTEMMNAEVVKAESVEDGKYIVGTPMKVNKAVEGEALHGVFEPIPTETTASDIRDSEAFEIVLPPADLADPLHNPLPGDLTQ